MRKLREMRENEAPTMETTGKCNGEWDQDFFTIPRPIAASGGTETHAVTN